MTDDRRSDADLMRDVARGSRECLELLICRHGPDVLTFIGRMVPEQHVRDDVFQEVFLAVWKSRHVNERADMYLHGLLTEDQAQEFRERCEVSADHRIALEEATARPQSLRSLPQAKLPDRLVRSTMELIDEQERHPISKTFWSIAAAAAALLLCFHVYSANYSLSPYDLTVMGQSEWIADAPASIRVRLINRETNEPLAGIPVTLTLASDRSGGRQVTLASFQTDTNGTGTPQLRIPDWDGTCRLTCIADTRGASEVVTRQVKLTRSWQVMLTSDKPRYQPGQTIRMRCLALRHPDRRPVASQSVVFRVIDPKGNVIYQANEISSRFGIASTDCPLAPEINHGNYQLHCTVGDTKSELVVEVRDYVLPKIKLSVELDRTFYQPGDLVRISATAFYTFGKPVIGGQVRIQPKWLELTDRLQPMQAETDSNGRVGLQFRIPELNHDQWAERQSVTLSLAAQVKDSAGQENKWTSRTIITRRPIHVELIPEQEILVPGVENKVYVYTTYADGRPAETQVTVSGIDRELSTNELGVTSFALRPETDRAVVKSIRVVDGQGSIGRTEVSIRCDQPSKSFLLRTDKSVYDGGETIQLTVIGSGHDVVYVDILKDGQTMLTKAIPGSKGERMLAIDLPPALHGVLELIAYRFDCGVVPIRKTKLLYVRPANNVAIDIATDKQSYRPGERAKLSFRLTGRDGTPVRGALGLSAVDEAVFAIQSANTRANHQYYQPEHAQLQSVKLPWSVDATRGPDQQELAQALFSNATPKRFDREAFLKSLLGTYLEDDVAILDLLNLPNWQQLIDVASLPPDVAGILLSDQAPYSLTGTTYPEKQAQAERIRRQWTSRAKTGWGLLLLVAFLGLMVDLTARSQQHQPNSGCSFTVVELLVVIMVIGILVGLALPASMSALRTARHATYASGLHNIAQAIVAAKQREGLPDLKAARSMPANPPRLRHYFPETMLWRPELITDDFGAATLELDLADSITDWRLSASAVTVSGATGATQSSIRVFQPFFVDLDLPVSMTRGDEITLPVTVYNYLKQTQAVQLQLNNADWFELLDDEAKRLEISPGEVASVGFRIRVTKIGEHQIEVNAFAGQVSDAIRRHIKVVSDGQRRQQVHSGLLDQSIRFDVELPGHAIDRSNRSILQIYPSTFSQLVDGIDAIFRRPTGCFEQTSSTTYPNVLALEYLRQTGQTRPSIEAKATHFIHIGYQRLLTFEVPGGGFEWFGNPPGNRTLTAYGLMEFNDMARVHDVDPRLLTRTRRWLLNQRRGDGSWAADGQRMHHDPTRSRDLATLAATAYIAWAVFSDNANDSATTLTYLKSHPAKSIDSAYVLALVSNALLSIDAAGGSALPYLQELQRKARTSVDGKRVWWQENINRRTIFYGAGRSGDIETTAIAAIAMMQVSGHASTARGALQWLIEQKDADGVWYSTQATVLALKALVQGAQRPLGGKEARKIEITIDDAVVKKILLASDHADVVSRVDLTEFLDKGRHDVRIASATSASVGYHFTNTYHVPDVSARKKKQTRLAVSLDFDRNTVNSGENVTATVTIDNRHDQSIPMLTARLPVPPGFDYRADSLRSSVDANSKIGG